MSRAATARLFVAVDPPPDVGERLSAWARAVAARAGEGHGSRRTMRVLAADTLHLTLCFLGSRPVGEIDALAAALGSCEALRCELSIGAPLWLPPRHPRALAVEVHDDGDGQLERLQAQATRALADVGGWEPPRRRFRAHITLARLASGARVGSAGDGLPPTPAAGFSPRSMVLYRSWLSPAGATYEALASFALLGPVD
jgi:2'-5' RNA ligase